MTFSNKAASPREELARIIDIERRMNAEYGADERCDYVKINGMIEELHEAVEVLSRHPVKAASPEREIVFALAERILEAATNVCVDPDGGPDDETSIRFTGNEGCEMADILFRLSLPVQSAEADQRVEPVAWRYTIRLEFGQTRSKITEANISPFGVPGEDHSEEYAVTCEPLYTTPPKPSGAPAMGGWRTIETAPRGQVVLTFELGHIAVSSKSADYRGVDLWSGSGYGDPLPAPSHWMPLPTPPTPQSQGAGQP